MDAMFYWTGLVVWCASALLVFWFVGVELLIVGFATSLSFHRWALSSPTSRFRWRKHTLPLLRSIAKKAVLEFWGYRNRGMYSATGSGGCWRGIGDWDMPNATPTGGDA